MFGACLLLLPLFQDHEPIVLNDDGGWCWFQDERALVDGSRLIFGSVAAGVRDPERKGDIELTTYDLVTGETSRFELHDQLELDDHDAPALAVLPDGRYLAVYARHGSDRSVRSRASIRPEDTTEWSPEWVHEVDEAENGVTYSNVFMKPDFEGGGTLVNFHRGKDWDPNWLVSDDLGRTWSYGGQVLGGPGRPYLRYAFDERRSIHFIATEQHPRDFDNSIYHGIWRNGRVLRSNGKLAADKGVVARPEDLTRVFEGGPERVAWTVDLEIDAGGNPYAAFSVQVDGAGLPGGEGGADHRYYYARWNGLAWTCHALAYAGSRLYAGEDDYTGLVALDPEEPDVVFISTDADPLTGEPLVSQADGERHHEIFRGETEDGGASWSWQAVTRDSALDNIRPVVPRSHGMTSALLWLRGTYRSYTDYDLAVVGLILPR